MIFDQILTKSVKMLTIYVKIHQIHVETIQECHFLKIKQINVKNHPEQKKSTSKINQDFGYWGIGGGIGVLGEK